MRAFLSYSLSHTRHYVVSVLARILREEGFTVSSSYSMYSPSVQATIAQDLDGANLFLGMVAGGSNEVDRVLTEYNYACDRSIPALLVIDRSIAPPELKQHRNVIPFDPTDLAPAERTVRSRIESAKKSLSPNKPDAAAWVFGGVAVLALISLLGNDKK